MHSGVTYIGENAFNFSSTLGGTYTPSRTFDGLFTVPTESLTYIGENAFCGVFVINIEKAKPDVFNKKMFGGCPPGVVGTLRYIIVLKNVDESIDPDDYETMFKLLAACGIEGIEKCTLEYFIVTDFIPEIDYSFEYTILHTRTVQSMVQLIDKDGDGKMSVEELLQFVLENAGTWDDPEYKVFFINDEETTLTNNTFSQAGFNYQNKIFRKETGTEIIFDKNYENYIEVDYNSIPEENVYYYTQENVPIDALNYIITNYLPWNTEDRTYSNNIQIAVAVGFVCGWLDLLGNMHNSPAFTDCSKTIEETFKSYDLITELDYFSIGMLLAENYVSGEIKLSNPFSVVGFIDGYYQELWTVEYRYPDFITRDEWDEIVATFDNIRDTYTMPYMKGGAKQMYDIDFGDWFVFAPKSFIGNVLMLLLPESAECGINTYEYVGYILNKSRLISDQISDDVPGLPHGLQTGVNLYETNSELFH